jgi:hypothetical protein
MPGLVPLLVAFAAVSLFMVHAMVQWSRALLDPEPSPARGRRRWRWGAVYGGAWAALIALGVGLATLDGGRPTRGDAALLVLVVGGYWGMHALLLWFARAIARANRRAAAARPAPADDEPEPEPEPGPAARPPVRARPGPLRRAAGWVGTLAVVLAVLALGEASPPLHALERALASHRGALLAVVIGLSAAGLACLMGGAIHMALRGGTPLGHAEVEAMARRRRDAAALPYAYRRSTYRIRGRAVGAGAEETVSFAEVKAAWRAGAWRVSARWRRILLMAAGALLMLVGMFGIPFVLGGPGMKLLVLAVWGYVLVQLVRGFRRA